MNLTDLGEGQQRPRRFVPGAQRLLVDPPGRLRIARDLQVLGKLVVTDGPPRMQQLIDLVAQQGVALNRRRVVGVTDPDVVPYPHRVRRCRQPPKTLPQLSNSRVQAGVDGRAGRPAAPARLGRRQRVTGHSLPPGTSDAPRTPKLLRLATSN